jgi:hypothetical protein
MLIADFIQLSQKLNRHKLIFITCLKHQTYWITNTSIVLSYVIGNISPQGRYCIKLARITLTNKNPRGIYNRKSDIPIIGIIITLYHSTTYFKLFNTNIQMQHVLYYKDGLRSQSIAV